MTIFFSATSWRLLWTLDTFWMTLSIPKQVSWTQEKCLLIFTGIQHSKQLREWDCNCVHFAQRDETFLHCQQGEWSLFYYILWMSAKSLERLPRKPFYKRRDLFGMNWHLSLSFHLEKSLPASLLSLSICLCYDHFLKFKVTIWIII